MASPAALQRDRDETRGMGLIDNRPVQRCLKGIQVSRRRSGFPEDILHVEKDIVTLARGQTVIALQLAAVHGTDSHPVPVEYRLADRSQVREFPAIHHRNGRSIGGILLVTQIIVFTDSLEIRNFRLKQVRNEGRIVKSGGRDFGRSESNIRTHIPELIGHFHRRHQACIEKDIVQVVWNRPCQVRDLNLLRGGSSVIILLPE